LPPLCSRMEQPLPDLPSETLRIADLSNNTATPFSLDLTAAIRSTISETLDITSIRKMTFDGEIAPEGETDWRLTAKLGATVTQPCVVTLDPVTSRIDEKITRRYLSNMPEIDGDEVEIPEDVSIEELPSTLDLYQVAIESLSLALPQFPRADGAAIGEISVTEPGLTPMSDDDAKPFAGLSDLKKALENKGSDGD